MIRYIIIKPYRLLELITAFQHPACQQLLHSMHSKTAQKNYMPTGGFFSNTDENSYNEILQVHKYYYLKHKQT
jgi:hypothetical protein